MPHERGLPVHTGASFVSVVEAKTENFFFNFGEPHSGHLVPFHLLERTRISLSRSHFSQ
jgi:hypothetical protein